MLIEALAQERKRIYQAGFLDGWVEGWIEGRRKALLALITARFQPNQEEQAILTARFAEVTTLNALTALTERCAQAETLQEIEQQLGELCGHHPLRPPG